MTTYTATQNGNWGSAATWGGGGYPNTTGDTAALGGYHVDFCADNGSPLDLSAIEIGGLTIGQNGVLHFPTAASAVYYLKLANNINIMWVGTAQYGTVLIGDSDVNPMPVTSKSTIEFQGTGTCSVGTFKSYCWYPERDGYVTYTTLAANSSSGTNTLTLSEEMGLKAGGGDIITVGIATAGIMAETEKGVYLTASYNNSTKVVTLTGNLSTNRVIGDYIGLLSRPNTLYCAAARTTAAFTPSGSTYSDIKGLYIHNGGCGYISNINEIYGLAINCGGANISTGIQWGKIGYFCVFAYNNSSYFYYAHRAYRCLFMQVGWYNRSAIASFWQNCVVQNSSIGQINNGDGAQMYMDCTFRACSSVVNGDATVGIRCYFNNCTTIGASANNKLASLSELFDINGVAGAYKCFTAGGYGVAQSSVQYDGNDTLKLTLSSAMYPVFRDYVFYIKGGAAFSVSVQCQKDFGGANVAGLYIVNPVDDPNINPGATLFASDIKANDIGTWEELSCSYTPANDTYVIVRVWAKAASGNVYFYTKGLEEMLPAAAGGTTIVRRPIYQL